MVPKQVAPALQQSVNAELAGLWGNVALRATESIVPKLDTASPYHLALIGGIATDKSQLLTGQATNRTESARMVYVQPGSLRRLSRRVLEGEFEELPELPEGPETA